MKKVLLSILLGFSLISITSPSIKAHAEPTRKTSVLEDLSKDESFDASEYSIRTFDYIYTINNDNDSTNDIPWVELIGIAEGENKELFLYTYQSCNNDLIIELSSVNLSLEFTSNGEIKDSDLYELELISQESVFNKYQVVNFTIPNETERFYNIIGVYTTNNGLKDDISGGTTSEIGIDIGQQWCVYLSNDTLIYEMNTFETLDVDITFGGEIKFANGFELDNLLFRSGAGYAHFACFNVNDYIVKHIYDSNITYRRVDVKERAFPTGTDVYENDLGIQKTKLTDTETVLIEGKGLSSKNYSWKRILSSSEFIDQLEDQSIIFTEESKNKILASQWVFSFLETEWKQYPYDLVETVAEYSKISDFTIMTLHFMDIHDDVYNLGVIADKVTSDEIVDGASPEPGIELDGLWDAISKLFDNMNAGFNIFALIIQIIGIVLGIALVVALMIIILKYIPIHEWIAGLLTLPFDKSKKKKRKQK